MTNEFQLQYRALCRHMLEQTPFHTGSWQSTDTSAQPLKATYELEDVTIRYRIPDNIVMLSEEVQPNLPWAEAHFAERVGGVPLNPPPSNKIWPWARHNTRFQDGGDTEKPFSHSYPERLWPRHAGHPLELCDDEYLPCPGSRRGVRFRYGDLADVVSLLVREPMTRQAYVPIWFPEDTGTHHGERVPCTLGYHFMMRNNELSCRYYMRSCDIIRHFLDDVYMAARLTQWICDAVNRRWDLNDHQQGDGGPVPHNLQPGRLIMYVSSLHAFVGDKWKLEQAANGK